MQSFRVRLASFGDLGLVSEPLMKLELHDGIYTRQQKKGIFSISVSYQKPLSNFTPNDMNIFYRNYAFVPDHFISYYS